MNRPPISVFVTLFLILLNAAFWLVFSALVAFGLIRSIPTTGVVMWIMAVLSLGCSLVLLGTAYFLSRRNRLAFHFASVLLALIAVLSIADDFGLPDLIALLVSLTALGLLIKDQGWYLQKENSIQ